MEVESRLKRYRDLIASINTAGVSRVTRKPKVLPRSVSLTPIVRKPSKLAPPAKSQMLQLNVTGISLLKNCERSVPPSSKSTSSIQSSVSSYSSLPVLQPLLPTTTTATSPTRNACELLNDWLQLEIKTARSRMATIDTVIIETSGCLEDPSTQTAVKEGEASSDLKSIELEQSKVCEALRCLLIIP